MPTEQSGNGRWVIRTTYRSGDAAWVGGHPLGTPSLTPSRGSAYRYDSEMAALGAAYHLRDALGYISAFEVEEVPRPSKWSGSEGTGGRGG